MRNVDDARDDVQRHFMVGLHDERRGNPTRRQLIERGAEAIERDDLIVEIENCLPFERFAGNVVLLRCEGHGDDKTAGRRTDTEGAAGRFNLDARLQDERRAKQEKAEQQQDDRYDRRKIEQAVERLDSAGEHQGHYLICPLPLTMTSARM